MPEEKQDEFDISSPERKPVLENDRFLSVIMGAPHKEEKEKSSDSKDSRKRSHIEDLKEMFKGREVEFSSLVTEKEQEIDRLRAIV
jgi:DNA polymerase elongation subunit (family B)